MFVSDTTKFKKKVNFVDIISSKIANILKKYNI